MSRISEAFQRKKLFIGYLTAGDGDAESKFLMLLDGGVDVLEIGIPFSDPIADGPVIQQAMKRAEGTALEDVLRLVRRLRERTQAPMILFTYYNPIMGDLDAFLLRAKEAGADGILTVDLPLEEGGRYARSCRRAGLDPIFVISPSTPLERIQKIASAGSGFLYYACRKGTTGARSGLPEDLSEKIALIRSVSDQPIAVGFGISSMEMAQAVLQDADGFVVGSYFVEQPERVYDFRS